MAVALKPEAVFSIGHFEVTNSLLTVFIIAVLLILFFVFYTNRLTVKPRSRFQLILESAVLSLHNLASGIMGIKLTKLFFPLIFTFFTLIIFSNWFGLLPFVGSIGQTEHIHEGEDKGLPILLFTDHGAKVSSEYVIHTPLFRSPSADLNFTLTLAIISFILIQYAGLKSLGLGHLGKFFDLRVKIPKGKKILMLPFLFLANAFFKILELILEISKIVSFSFRLFGNIFAGEVLLFIMTTLTFGLVTLPFLGLEIFVGLIQATVFVFLTMVFIKLSTESHGEHHEDGTAA